MVKIYILRPRYAHKRKKLTFTYIKQCSSVDKLFSNNTISEKPWGHKTKDMEILFVK